MNIIKIIQHIYRELNAGKCAGLNISCSKKGWRASLIVGNEEDMASLRQPSLHAALVDLGDQVLEQAIIAINDAGSAAQKDKYLRDRLSQYARELGAFSDDAWQRWAQRDLPSPAINTLVASKTVH